MSIRKVAEVCLRRSAVLMGISLYGQELDATKQAQKSNEAESALFEKLKGYIQENDVRAEKVIQELVGYGSSNVVQFFLGNISWNSRTGEVIALTTPRTFDSFFPMLQALLRVENVPLHQCVDTLIRSKDGTVEAQMIAHIAQTTHGEDFLREVEKLAETSPDTERWENMKKRLENVKAKQKEQTTEKGGN